MEPQFAPQQTPSGRVGGDIRITGNATNSIIAGNLSAKTLIYGDTSKNKDEVVKWLYQVSKLQSESGIHSVYCEKLENLLRISSSQPLGGVSLLLDKSIREWVEGTSTRLWLVGSPGVDKSTLSATLIHDLLDHGRHPPSSSACVYAFLGRECEHLQTPENVIKNLLAQLVGQKLKVSKELQDSYDDWQKRGQFSMKAAVSLMMSEVASFNKAFLVLDALDGCWRAHGTNATAWAELLAQIKQLSSRFNVLVVSGEDQIIQNNFIKAKKVSISKLSNTPLGKDKLYELAISKIERQDASALELAIRALVWLTFAERSLTVAEMTHALSIGGNDGNETPRKQQLFHIITGGLAQMCANLIVIEGESGRTRVRLVDPSARDVLKPWLKKVRSNPESVIAKECLECILHDDLKKELSEEEFKVLIDRAPLLKYASNHWYTHVESFQQKQGEVGPLSRVEECMSDGKTTSNIARAIDGLEHEGIVTGLHLASFWGLPDMVKGLYSRAIDQARAGRGLYPDESRLVNKATSTGKTPLHFAASRDHCEIISQLIELGADAKASDRSGKTPLHQAIASGHKLPVLALLERELDINAVDNNGATPLIIAAKHGMIDVVKYLDKHKADLDKEDDFGCTAMRNATEGNHSAIVWYLLERGARWRSSDRNWSLFHWAVTQGQASILDFLAKQGEDINATRPGMDGTPLMTTVRYDHWKASWLLIQLGAKLELSNDEGDTALHVAIRYKRESLMWLLLQSGADLNQRNKAGMAALHELASIPGSSSSQSVVWLLVQSGAKVESQDKNKQSPLHLAAKHGNVALTNFLVNMGQASLNILDRRNRTALHVAADKSNNNKKSREVIRILVGKAVEADLKALDENGESALHIAARRYNGPLVLELCSPETIDQEDENGKTALQRVIENYNSDSKEARQVVWCLIENGADVNRRIGDRGRTLVHLAALKGHADVIKMMLKLSMPDINMPDENGLTPVALASNRGHRDLTDILLANTDCNYQRAGY